MVRHKLGYLEMQGIPGPPPHPSPHGCWALLPLVVLQTELFKEVLTQAGLGSLGGGHSADVGQVVTHLLEEFDLLVKEVVLQETQR